MKIIFFIKFLEKLQKLKEQWNILKYTVLPELDIVKYDLKKYTEIKINTIDNDLIWFDYIQLKQILYQKQSLIMQYSILFLPALIEEILYYSTMANINLMELL